MGNTESSFLQKVHQQRHDCIASGMYQLGFPVTAIGTWSCSNRSIIDKSKNFFNTDDHLPSHLSCSAVDSITLTCLTVSSLTPVSATDGLERAIVPPTFLFCTTKRFSALEGLGMDAAHSSRDLYFFEARHGFLVNDSGCCCAEESASLLDPNVDLFARESPCLEDSADLSEDEDDDDLLLRDGGCLIEELEPGAEGTTGLFGNACAVECLAELEDFGPGRGLLRIEDREPECDCFDAALSDCTESLLDDAGEDCFVVEYTVDIDDPLFKGELDPLLKSGEG